MPVNCNLVGYQTFDSVIMPLNYKPFDLDQRQFFNWKAIAAIMTVNWIGYWSQDIVKTVYDDQRQFCTLLNQHLVVVAPDGQTANCVGTSQYNLLALFLHLVVL